MFNSDDLATGAFCCVVTFAVVQMANVLFEADYGDDDIRTSQMALEEHEAMIERYERLAALPAPEEYQAELDQQRERLLMTNQWVIKGHNEAQKRDYNLPLIYQTPTTMVHNPQTGEMCIVRGHWGEVGETIVLKSLEEAICVARGVDK